MSGQHCLGPSLSSVPSVIFTSLRASALKYRKTTLVYLPEFSLHEPMSFKRAWISFSLKLFGALTTELG
jgi:hypothetical protein